MQLVTQRNADEQRLGFFLCRVAVEGEGAGIRPGMVETEEVVGDGVVDKNMMAKFRPMVRAAGDDLT